MILVASCGNKSVNSQSAEVVVPEGYQTYETSNFSISVPKDFKKTDLSNDNDHLQFDSETLLKHSDGDEYTSSIKVDAAFNTGWSTDLMGNAFNMKDYANALASYKKAASLGDNELTAGYLLKAGLVSEEMGDNDGALKFYKEIETKYPQTLEGYDIQKYISRIENK